MLYTNLVRSHLEEIAHAVALGLRRIIRRDLPAAHDARAPVARVERRLERRPAHIIEVHVDTVGAQLGERARDGEPGRLVVERAVEAELVEPRALRVGPRRADHAAAVLRLRAGRVPSRRQSGRGSSSNVHHGVCDCNLGAISAP